MTNITFGNAGFNDFYLKCLDLISFKDHRGLTENVLVVDVRYNANLCRVYFEITGIVDGNVSTFSLNRYNIISRKRLSSAKTTEKYKRFKILPSFNRFSVGDFVLDRNNDILIVRELADDKRSVCRAVNIPSPDLTVKNRHLQKINSVELTFKQLEVSSVPFQDYRVRSCVSCSRPF